MNSWLEQPGYPVVEAKVENGDLVLSQQQFFIGEGKEAGRQWQIPLNSNYEIAPEIFADKTINLGNYSKLRQQNGKPFRINVGNNSHFIVKYDETLLNDILASATSLAPIDQLQVLQDLRLLAEGRQISYASIVPLLANFADSKSNIVNAILYQIAGDLRKFVTPDSDEEATLRKLYDKLSKNQVARLGWQLKAGESNDDQLTRPYVLSASLYAKNADSIAAAHKLFIDNRDHLDALPADVRAFVLRNEIKNYGSESLFDELLSTYVQTSDASYKADIRAALTSTPDQKLIAKIVDKFEDAGTIKPQDLRGWYAGVLSNDDGQQADWDWIRKDWQWLEDTVGGDMEFATFITVTSRVFKTSSRLSEFKEFFEPKLNTPGLTREIEMDIHIIETRVNLVEAEKVAVNAAVADSVK
ncbi:lysyl aminopeptidase [Lentilactobacillus kosonis]|uniref:Lysyl aminopeptidase n=1 Tax=Lentilactobacillus kosonis TaxID=2810561 RepID=A0A401FLR6_9LACO|nr:lysyl aminopeptidase [Lentilactobacillus kosonis]